MDAVAAGTLNIELMMEFKLSSMNVVVTIFETKLQKEKVSGRPSIILDRT